MMIHESIPKRTLNLFVGRINSCDLLQVNLLLHLERIVIHLMANDTIIAATWNRFSGENRKKPRGTFHFSLFLLLLLLLLLLLRLLFFSVFEC